LNEDRGAQNNADDHGGGVGQAHGAAEVGGHEGPLGLAGFYHANRRNRATSPQSKKAKPFTTEKVLSHRRSCWCATDHARSRRSRPFRRLTCLVAFEVLDGALVGFGFRERGKRPKVTALPCLEVPLARIQAVLAGLEFANHRTKPGQKGPRLKENDNAKARRS